MFLGQLTGIDTYEKNTFFLLFCGFHERNEAPMKYMHSKSMKKKTEHNTNLKSLRFTTIPWLCLLSFFFKFLTQKPKAV